MLKDEKKTATDPKHTRLLEKPREEKDKDPRQNFRDFRAYSEKIYRNVGIGDQQSGFTEEL
jgi:hypothetical protein